mgnify:FL=1|tara:strand:+ start:226 stop:1242 length:1017 start_codon:yes stop_codon:yes gene_type:complete
MANVANKGTFATYSGANLNEIFYEPVFRSDDIMRNYRVIPNVKHKMNVFTSAALTKIVAKYDGCSATSGSTQFDIDEKTITAGRMRVALEQCSKEFFGTYIEEMYRNGVDVMNVEGTQLADAIVNRAVKGIAQDVVRLAWGDDTGSGVAGYGNMDGWMKLMGAGSAPRFTENAATDNEPTNAEVLAGLRKLFDEAPAALQQVAAADKRFYVTPLVYNTYLQSLEGSSADLGITNIQNGYQVVKFRGVEIIPMYEWDTILADTDPTLFANTAGGVTTNYTQGICYTAVDNLIIGSDVTDPEGSFKVFYDDLEEKMFFRGYFKLGVQYLYDSLYKWVIFI